LKITGPFVAGRTARVKCPKCAAPFAINYEGVQTSPSNPPPIRQPESVFASSPPAEEFSDPVLAPRSGAPWLALALVCTVLIMGGGIAVAVFFATSERPRAEVVRPEPAKTVAQNRPVEDAAARREREKKQHQFQRLMIDAGVAMRTKHYDEAATAYAAALALVPDDAEAQRGLQDARAALGPAADDEKRQVEYARLMKQGKAALAGRHYAAAARAFEVAILMKPGDSGAEAALNQAKEGLAKDEHEQKVQDEFQVHMTAGRALMVAQRYAEAMREFVAAKRLIPNDEEAGNQLQTAEKRLAAVQGQNQNQARFAQLMKQAGNAMDNKRYKEAVDKYQAARKIEPNDQDAKDGLTQARKAFARARGQYAQLMAAGQAAANAMRANEAVQDFQAALQLFPGDDAATLALQNAQQLVGNVVGTQALYDLCMIQGNRLFQAKRYGDAALAYWEALQLVPWDLDAAQGLIDSQNALNTVTVAAQSKYNQQMQAAAAAYARGRYSDAITILNSVLQAYPNDPKAQSALQQSQYKLHMVTGARYYAAGQYANAVTEFKAALTAAPGDGAALRALQQASQKIRQPLGGNGLPVQGR
jgi:tetratricopeptide (TPR) repeat protein